MSANAVELLGVHKKFRRGQLHDSLRDFLPSLGRRIVTGRASANLGRTEFWALQDVSFSVPHGEAFAIIGGNGAGKSTMLKLLSRIMRPTQGTVRVEGRLTALIEVGAGFHQDLTGRENIYLNGAVLGMSRTEIARHFDEIVAFSGLESFIDTPVKRYSSGMFARLGFSVAAHVDADILLVDEVLSVGDYLFQRKCIERINQVIKGGATVVFVSHNLRAVAEVCPRSLLLERGRVTQIGATTDVIRSYLAHGGTRRVEDSGRAVVITRVAVNGVEGPGVAFESGSRVHIVVEAECRSPIDDVSVVIQVADEQGNPFFDTCTQRLGAGPLHLDTGSALRCEFELSLQLGEGTYYVNAHVHRYVTSESYDQWEMAATWFVRSTPRMRGAADLKPALVACEVGSSRTVLSARS